jgi:hypothetical protein
MRFILRAKYPENPIWRKYYGAYSNGRQRCWCGIARASENKTIVISVIGIAMKAGSQSWTTKKLIGEAFLVHRF